VIQRIEARNAASAAEDCPSQIIDGALDRKLAFAT